LTGALPDAYSLGNTPLAIAGLVLLFRRRRGEDRPRGSSETLLDERYARGEISEDEYRQRKAVLRIGPR
jgi:putative membrane protein